MDLVVAGLAGASTAGGTALVAIVLEDLYRRAVRAHRRRLRSRRPPNAAAFVGHPRRPDPMLAIHVHHAGALQVGNGNTQHNILR